MQLLPGDLKGLKFSTVHFIFWVVKLLPASARSARAFWDLLQLSTLISSSSTVLRPKVSIVVS